MSKIEIVAIICASLIPVIALIMLLPKHLKLKKQKKVKAVETTPYVPEKAEQSVKQEETPTDNSLDYAKRKRAKLSAPKRNIDSSFADFANYMPRRINPAEEKPKTVAEEINALSPTLKAMIFAGVLDKKNLDE